jgi:hypothetical protein
MKVISIRQPWAWAIIWGGKDVENRTWTTGYRGPVAIHASASFDTNAVLPKGVRPPSRDQLDRGAIIGVVELAQVVDRSSSRWFQGPYGFVLRKKRPLSKAIRCNGRLRLWRPTARQARLIAKRI